MTVESKEIQTEGMKVVDDVSEKLDTDKLAALKAKMNAKKDEMPLSIVAEKKRSLKFGVIGTGQAGSRLAESFYVLGYPSLAFNTAPQDLQHIQIPEANKFLLEHGIGGAAKELTIGQAAAERHRDKINEAIQMKLGDAQVLFLCLSLGGGSGAGSASVFIDVLANVGKPVICICVLPMSAEDAQTKQNALETLSLLSKEVQNKRIHNLIVVDNTKLESLLSHVSTIDFYDVANKTIIAPLEVFNMLSMQPSSVKALDSMEFAKLLTDGNGLTVYGKMTVTNYEEETAIAEAIIGNLEGNLLASGFDLKQARYVGVMIVARKSVWDKVPSAATSYANSIVGDLVQPIGLFRGIYVSEDCPNNVIEVWSMFSGLGLPESRVVQLKDEVKELSAKTKTKDAERNLHLKLDTGTEQTVSAADKIRQQIARKNSAFGTFAGNVQDLRKK